MEQNPDQSELEINHNEVVTTFEEMGLKNDLLRGIFSYGYEYPSAIQQRAIKPCIDGRDVIAQAQSGTGKTATFAISILQKIDTTENTCQALVLGPTRELAKQILTVIRALGANLDVKCYGCIGGTSAQADARNLGIGQHVVVGTPGRVRHMLEEKNLPTANIRIFVLDEADEMLSRGFQAEIQDIYRMLPGTAQIMLLSATMPKDMIAIAQQITQNPVEILVKKEELTLDGINQFYVNVEKESNKLGTLMDIYGIMNLCQVVIFVNTVRKADELYKSLTDENFKVSLMTGEMGQQDRDDVMAQYRTGDSRILLSTDILARGIDVQQVSLVVNYDLPKNRETYIHRIGRSGRFGRKGTALNFITEDDSTMLNELQAYYKTEIIQMPADIADYL